MVNELSAEEIRALLKLAPHTTCGFVRVTFVSETRIAPGGLPPPFTEGRPTGSALYFMVTPDAPVRLHRIRNDQLYHYYLGDPIEVLMLHADRTTERVVVGPDLRGGQRVQLLIPGNTFHTARVIPQGFRGWFLWRKHRMARRGTGRCRNRQCRSADQRISRRGRGSARIPTR
jgi:uncharacterized protein